MQSSCGLRAIRRATLVCLLGVDRAFAQSSTPPQIHVTAGAQGILAASAIRPGIFGARKPEIALTQPAFVAHVSAGPLFVASELNFEGITLRRGELNPGIFGEGYIDRRHPHTMIHELVIGWGTRLGPLSASLAGGKGFAPFGTDDPMSRPLVKYPANHHLAQILERVVGIAAVRMGDVGVELATFNGDEPITPWSQPVWSRFGDSWAARGTWSPQPGLEIQASRAFVESPESPFGALLDQRKRSVSVRLEPSTSGNQHAEHGIGTVSRQLARVSYVFLEWGDTYELDRGVEAFRLTTLLGESAIDIGRLRVALRIERTTRPEDERTLDRFRTPRPKSDLLNLGRTRWDISSVHIARRSDARRPFALDPFIETAYVQPRSLGQGAFDPFVWYGTRSMVSVAVGVRMYAGARHARMGRYGAATFGHAMPASAQP